eukprot:844993-Pyramimonas_sp.AAC.1
MTVTRRESIPDIRGDEHIEWVVRNPWENNHISNPREVEGRGWPPRPSTPRRREALGGSTVSQRPSLDATPPLEREGGGAVGPPPTIDPRSEQPIAAHA